MADAVIRKPGFGAAALTFLLSLLLPPAGYLYVGHARRGFAQLAVLIALIAVPLFGPAALFQSAAGVAAYVAVGVAALLAFPMDAVRLLLTGRARRGLPYQRWWSYAAVVAGWFGYGVADAALTEADMKVARSYSVPSESALPTLRPGDVFFATRWDAPLRRGDLVVYRVANDARVGRVMALGGDRIAMRGGVVVLNGAELKREPAPPLFWSPGLGGPVRDLPVFRETNAEGRSYLTLDLNADGFLDNTDEVDVPAGHVFLMGDNRDNSLDSRAPRGGGFVPEANVVRRAGLIYWSRDTGRIGTVVE